MAEDDVLVVDGHEIKCLAVKEGPAALPWKELGVDIVIESTGLFTEAEKARGHITAGAKKVIISAPGKDEDITVVMGVNHEKYDAAQAPHHLQRELHHELPRAGRARAAEGRFRHRGRPHDDRPQLHRHAEDRGRPFSKKDWKGGRSAAINIIPSGTGAAKAVGARHPRSERQAHRHVVPRADPDGLRGRPHRAARPKTTSYKEICAAMKKASETYLKGILGLHRRTRSSRPTSSTTRTARIFDAGSGIELNSNFFKLISWYDNEWGYSNRCVDLVRYIAGK